nr:MAG TPA: rhoptry-associated protein 1 [Bacteriophage sp.]
MPNTELIVSCTLPNLYQLEVIKQRLNKSLHTEFPI